MLLIAWQEKDCLFHWVRAIFGLSIIYSTLYLEIHWVVDVIGGMILALTAVKLGDWLIGQLPLHWGFRELNTIHVTSAPG